MPNARPHQRTRGVPFGRLWVFLSALLCAWALLPTLPRGSFSREAWAQQREAPTLLCPTESDVGLTGAHTEALLAWVRDGYTAA